MRSRPFVAPLCSCLLLALPCFAPAQEAFSDPTPALRHKLSLGGYFSAGDYGGAEETIIRYLPLSYELSRFPWILSVTLPWLSLEGPGDVFLEAGNVGGPALAGALIDEDGVGDVLLSGTWQLDPLPGGLFLDLGLQLKLPTADETRDLGTGEADLSVQADLYRRVGDVTWFATFGYRHRGRTPLYDLRDSAYGSLGAMHPWGEAGRFGLLYDFRQAASSSAHETHELMPFYAWEPGGGWSVMLYSVFGFTDSSADRAGGLQFSYSWP